MITIFKQIIFYQTEKTNTVICLQQDGFPFTQLLLCLYVINVLCTRHSIMFFIYYFYLTKSDCGEYTYCKYVASLLPLTCYSISYHCASYPISVKWPSNGSKPTL